MNELEPKIFLLRTIKEAIEVLIEKEIDLDSRIPEIIIINLAELHSNLEVFFKGNKDE